MNDFFISAMLLGALSTGDGQPFWATANRYGLMPDNGFALGVVDFRRPLNGSADAGIGNGEAASLRGGFEWQAGVSLACALESRDGGVSAVPAIDELYGGIRWKALRLDAGMMHREREFLGSDPSLGSISSTEGHVIESNNARTLPGYRLVLEPWYIPYTRKHLSISGVWGDYLTTDSRYMQDALVHRLRGYLRYDIVPGLYAQLGLDHYTLWAGSNQTGGKMDASFKNYFRIVSFSDGSAEDSVLDKMNKLGDHGGSEQLRIGWERDGRGITFQYEKPYADKGSMKHYNLPDGIYSLNYSFADKDRWVSDIMLDFHYTKWQSGTIQVSKHDDQGNLLPPDQRPKGTVVGGDNYFKNGDYKSGWTHYGRGICAPLFFTGYGPDGVWTIRSNRHKAVNLGLSGKFFREYPYRLMLTAGEYYGTYHEPYIAPSSWGSGWKWWKKNTIDKGLFQFSAGLDGAVRIKSGRLPGRLSLTYGIYADFGKVLPHNVGAVAGISIAL